MFHRTSQRTNIQFKPKFLRLKFLQRKRDDGLKFNIDEEFMLHVIPRCFK